jgi:hypothetical protein
LVVEAALMHRRSKLTGVDVDPHRPGVSAAPTVGREAEVARLRRLVTAGDGIRIGLVGGEAGIGKTRVVDDAVAAVPDGSVIVRFQGDPARRSRPYSVLVGALEPFVIDWTAVPGPLEARADAVGALLAPVVPELASPAGVEVGIESLERAAVDLLRYVAPDLGSLVIVADDLHWTDPETVVILQQLAMGAPGLDDLVILGTYRSEGLLARSPLSALLASSERRSDAVSIRLDPLRLDDVADYASAAFGCDVPYRAVTTLHHRSGGNPFFLGELIAMAVDQGVDAIADLPLPWTVAEALRDTVMALDDGERSVVETAAVLGQRVPFDLLSRVMGLDERALIARLRGVVAAGLLVEEEVDLFVFRHALVRESVAGGLLGRERRRVHEAALDVLTGLDGADDADIARHAAGAGRIDVMVDAVRRAATAALRRGSPYHALEFAEDGLAEAPDDLVLGEVATRGAWLVGALADATAHGTRWVRAAGVLGDPVAESRARRVLMRIAIDSGDDVAHRREFERLRSLVEEMSPGEDRAAVLADLAQASMLAGNRDETEQFVTQAIEEAVRAGVDRPRVQALVERWSIGPPPEGDAAAQVAEMLAAVAEAERLGDHLTAARGLNNIVELVPVEERRRLIERMKADAESAGFTALSSYSYAEHLAELASLAADRPELERRLAEAWRWCRVGQCSRSTHWLRFYDALLVTEATDPEQVLDHHFVPQAPTGPSHSLAALMSGLLRAGRRADAVAAGVALATFDGPAPRLRCDARNVAIAVDAALRAGVEPDRVRALVAGVTAQGATASPLSEALLALAAGTPEVAESLISRIGDEAEAWLRAEVHLRIAEAVAEHRPAVAADHATRASALLARWPGWRRDRADALLRRLERRTDRTAPMTSRRVRWTWSC